YTVELGGTAEPEPRWISTQNQTIGNLRWLPDQSVLIGNLYVPYPTRVQMIHFDLATGAVTPITELGPTGMPRDLDVSPDGRTIAFNTGTGELRFITLSGDPAVGYPTHLRGLSPAFSPDGRLLAWSKVKDGSLEMDGIWFYRFSDGAMWRALPEGSPLTWLRDWGGSAEAGAIRLSCGNASRSNHLFNHEHSAWQSDCLLVGIDEVGRGPLAGPVVAAAVVLPRGHCGVGGVRDSKQVKSRAEREALARAIRREALCLAVGAATVTEIDELNILRATT